jgi:alkylation response protein AidB-like acyl-CoA dehydrogenase
MGGGLMNVDVAEMPAGYDGYRSALRDFLAGHVPTLAWKQRTGVRVPDVEADIDALRAFARALHDAGYRRQRFSTEELDGYEQRILEQELAATGLVGLGNPLVAGAIKMFGTPEQQARFLEPMSRGDHVWTQLFSEPDAGSDLASLQTRAERDGDEYVVSGQKVWSTWAQWSDYGYLLARTEPTPGPAGISAFILDMRSPGVDVRPLREMTGTTDFNEVFLDGVRVPVDNLIGRPGEGWGVAQASLLTERSGVGSAGGGGGMVRDLLDVAREHRRGGRPAIDHDDVRQQLGGFFARLRVQRALGQKVATKATRGQFDAWDAPVSKIWFSELNVELCEFALRLQGPRSALAEGDPGCFRDGEWQDRFLYSRAWTIAGGSNEIMRNLIAERGLGLPKEPRG